MFDDSNFFTLPPNTGSKTMNVISLWPFFEGVGVNFTKISLIFLTFRRFLALPDGFFFFALPGIFFQQGCNLVFLYLKI